MPTRRLVPAALLNLATAKGDFADVSASQDARSLRKPATTSS